MKMYIAGAFRNEVDCDYETEKVLKERETTLKYEYEEFIKTDEGKQWIGSWNRRMPYGEDVGFGEYLYDFYPEMLQ